MTSSQPVETQLSVNGRQQTISMYNDGEEGDDGALQDVPAGPGGMQYVDASDILSREPSLAQVSSARDPGSRQADGEASTSLPAISPPRTGKAGPAQRPARQSQPPKSAGRQSLPSTQRSSGGASTQSASYPRSPTSPKSTSALSPGEKPPPRARHDLSGIDPAFIETAAFRKKKGVGVVRPSASSAA